LIPSATVFPPPTLAEFAEAVRQVAAEQAVPMIDLNAKSLLLYGSLGPEGSKKVFLHDDADRPHSPQRPTG
jgi:hypothetical protein